MFIKWFQDAEYPTAVVGRFVEVEVVDVKASELARKNIYKKVPALESKIAGQTDVAVQAVKEFNKKELTERFPGAWEHFEEHREREEPRDEIKVIKAIKGTPLHEMEGMPRASIPLLNELGFSTVEMVAAMSDAVAQNVKGGRNVRKLAQEHLTRT